MDQPKHFILAGRLVGEDDGWVDCVCGWHFQGTIKASHEAGEEHMRANDAVFDIMTPQSVK